MMMVMMMMNVFFVHVVVVVRCIDEVEVHEFVVEVQLPVLQAKYLVAVVAVVVYNDDDGDDVVLVVVAAVVVILVLPLCYFASVDVRLKVVAFLPQLLPKPMVDAHYLDLYDHPGQSHHCDPFFGASVQPPHTFSCHKKNSFFFSIRNSTVNFFFSTVQNDQLLVSIDFFGRRFFGGP
jgi:hypothetical protein